MDIHSLPTALPTASTAVIGGLLFVQICGHGIASQHIQRWQAELFWEQACLTNGIPLPPDWRMRPLGDRAITA